MTQIHEVLQMAQLFDFVEEVVVWVKDCQHRYCWVNQAFLLNYEASRPREIQLKESKPGVAFDAVFGSVLEHMRDHFAAPLTNRRLAGIAHMSLRSFERKFRASFHLTPQHYLKRLRLQMASRALVFTGQSLVEVAQGCGFCDQSHFTREFGKHFGRTPREFRVHYTR
jgi:transcriptional regulator GlxA family with amidase domain